MTVINYPLSTSDIYPNRSINDINWIVIHHDAVPFYGSTRDEEMLRIETVHKNHINLGWPGIAYHYYIFKSGNVYKLGGLDTVRYHTAGPADPETANRISIFNEQGIGIAFSGLLMGLEPTEEALEACRKLIEDLRLNIKADLKIEGHKDLGGSFYPTECPGNTWPNWKGRLEDEKETPLNTALNTIWGVSELLEALKSEYASQLKEAVRILKGEN